MVGGGIFAVLGEAVSLAHGATAVAFALAGLVALLTSYSYARLSLTYQSQGGTVVFIDHAFKHSLLSSSMSFLLWLSYLVTISLYAVAFASYALTFYPQWGSSVWAHHFFISIAIILPAAINLLSATFVSRSETLIVVTKVVLLLLIIFSSIPYIEPERLSPHRWGGSFSILVAGMIIFVAYEGFELIANAAEEIKQPQKNITRAFYYSVVLVIVLYVLIALVAVGTVDEPVLLKAKDYALAIAAKPAMGQAGFTLVAVAALLATFSAINATIYGNARLGYILAKEGELPELLDREKRNIPFVGVLVTVALSLILANSINLDEIAIIGSASFLFVFFVVNLSAVKLYKKIGAKLAVVIAASFASLLALIILLTRTWQSNPRAVWIFIAFIVIALIFEWFYGRLVRKHFLQRSY